MYLFLALWGLHCCVQAFFGCGEQGLFFSSSIVVQILIAVASLAAEPRL